VAGVRRRCCPDRGGNDDIDGQAGGDFISGEDGNDHIYGGANAASGLVDFLIGGDDVDEVYGEGGPTRSTAATVPAASPGTSATLPTAVPEMPAGLTECDQLGDACDTSGNFPDRRRSRRAPAMFIDLCRGRPAARSCSTGSVMRESTMVNRRRVLMTVGAAVVLAVTAAPPPAWADLEPGTIVYPECFGRQYQLPVYMDGQLIRPGTLGVIFAVPGVTTYGTAGDDLIIGTSGPDQIWGMSGDDTICGGDGADHIEGDGTNEVEPGNDFIHGEDATDHLYGGGGNDAIYGGNNHPNNPYREHLQGDDGVDRLYGENGADNVICGTLIYGALFDPGDFANGGTGMPGNAPEDDHGGSACPLTINVEYW